MFTHEFHGDALRGAFDDNQKLWLPAEDIAKLRGTKRLDSWIMYRAGLRADLDFTVVSVNSDLAHQLRLKSSPGGGNQRRILISESGLYMLMMKGRSQRDRLLQYWLADEVIPAIRKYGQYNLPTEHPIYAVLEEVSAELKVYRDIVWNRTELTLGDLAGHNDQR